MGKVQVEISSPNFQAYLKERLPRRESHDDQAEEQPEPRGLVPARVVVDLSHALDEDLVTELLPIDPVPDDRLDRPDLELALQLAASVLAQVL